MTFEEDGRTFLGTSPEVAAITLDALGADALGINCSLGPAELRPLAQRMLAVTEKPVIVQANAGPSARGGRPHRLRHRPEAYAAAVADMVADGVAASWAAAAAPPPTTSACSPRPRDRARAAHRRRPPSPVTSAQRVVSLPRSSRRIAVIGERINPTGKKRLQQALRDGDLDYVVGQGISQQEQGADILDVNVGLPEIDEANMMARAASSCRRRPSCRCRSTRPTRAPSRPRCAATPASPSSTR